MVPVDRHREGDGRAGRTIMDRAGEAHQNVSLDADSRQSDNDPDDSDTHEVRGKHRDHKCRGGRRYRLEDDFKRVGRENAKVSKRRRGQDRKQRPRIPFGTRALPSRVGGGNAKPLDVGNSGGQSPSTRLYTRALFSTRASTSV